MVMDRIQDTVRWNAYQPPNMNIEYGFSITDPPEEVSVQPVASEGVHVICPQAVAHFFVQPVLQPHVEHAPVVWCLVVGAVRCQVCVTDDGLGQYQQVVSELLGSGIENAIAVHYVSD